MIIYVFKGIDTSEYFSLENKVEEVVYINTC